MLIAVLGQCFWKQHICVIPCHTYPRILCQLGCNSQLEQKAVCGQIRIKEKAGAVIEYMIYYLQWYFRARKCYHNAVTYCCLPFFTLIFVDIKVLLSKTLANGTVKAAQSAFYLHSGVPFRTLRTLKQPLSWKPEFFSETKELNRL